MQNVIIAHNVSIIRRHVMSNRIINTEITFTTAMATKNPHVHHDNNHITFAFTIPPPKIVSPPRV